MQNRQKTLLLLNTGAGENLGDRAMLTNTVGRLRAQYPDWQLLVSARTPGFLVEEFRLERVSFMIDCLSRWGLRPSSAVHGSRLTQLLYATLGTTEFVLLALVALVCKAASRRPLGRFMEAEFIRTLLDADAVLFVGGGYLTDQGKLECRALLTTGLLAMYLRKPVILSGQGLGPFSTRLTRWLMRRVTNHAEMIGLRDSGHGKSLLVSLGVSTAKAETVCDDALTLSPSYIAQSLPKTIGIHWRVSPHQADTQRVQNVLECMLDKLACDGWTILLFQFHEREKYEASIYRQWLSSGRWPSARLIKDRDPRVLRAEIASCTVALGMAYHFSVFALAAAVPVLGLWHKPYYRDKIGGLMTAFGHPEWALDDRVISPDSLYETLTKMAASDCRPALVKRGSELAALHEDWQTRVDTRLSQI
ncbi:polysaccharide pyruvyl transferase family protein [Niveibacterium microcysteis]|uniref:Polysaccharide pyruvyl transferase family protein n=1 Tax=Niveibacterium microcysteis TaxID=2811415 RepID=A0ABX7MB97_9RHOO|nr:polysaccharide pyruvyl transferase family protein [Niveibacterium microcysteis]QSI78151.1 polysaccharide pyruvyl transferase family protein [Niveibacterium microcysteis]